MEYKMKQNQISIIWLEIQIVSNSYSTNFPMISSGSFFLPFFPFFQLLWVWIRNTVYSLQTFSLNITFPVSTTQLNRRKIENSITKIKNVVTTKHLYELTFVTLNAFTLPVWRTCGPRHKSIKGPHLYTVVVGVFTFSFNIRCLNSLYYKNNKPVDDFPSFIGRWKI